MGYLPRGKIRGFFKSDMIGLEGALFKRWKLEGNEGSEVCSKGNEGSRAHSKGGRIENFSKAISILAISSWPSS
jgi:hypothetical protein